LKFKTKVGIQNFYRQNKFRLPHSKIGGDIFPTPSLETVTIIFVFFCIRA